MKLTDVNNLTHFGLEDPRMTTIGGVAFRYLDRLPQIGDRVEVDDVALTVLEMEAHRISRVRIAKVAAEEDFEELTDEEQQRLTRDSDTEIETEAGLSQETVSITGLDLDEDFEGRDTQKSVELGLPDSPKGRG
jgi:hypothetical protein